MATLTPLAEPTYARIRLTVGAATGTEVMIYRVASGNQLVPVRNADPLVPISGVGEVYDYEAPLNVPVTYHVVDDGVTTISTPVTITTTQAWLKSPGFPNKNQVIKLRSLPKFQRSRAQGVHTVLNRSRPIVTFGSLGSATSSMTLLTGNELATLAMLDFLEATGIAYIQVPGSRFSEKYLALGDIDESALTRFQTEDAVDWTISIVEVDRPDGGLEGNPTSTYQSMKDGIATYTILKNTKSNYLAVMRGTGVPITPPNPGSF